MNVGAFVCSCDDTCALDLDAVRDGVDDVDVVASSSLLCEDGLAGMSQLVAEYELDQLIVTACDDRCERRFRTVAEENGLHPEATAVVDHRESAGWVHDERTATAKTARLVNARVAGLEEEALSRTVSRETGDHVAVVGDPETAAALADSATVTLVADGTELSGVDASLEDVDVARGRVVDVSGSFGSFEVTLESRVTEDCVSCMRCVVEGPPGKVTRWPVDVAPDAEGGEWVDVCPTDAIDLDGVRRRIEVDQVVYPDATDAARGGRVGFYTGSVDAATIAAVESHLNGVEKPKFLDLDMDVCAAGESSQRGCNACVDACPHGAVERRKIDEVEFDEVACQNCGACTSSCPTGATMLREPSNERLAREVEALLDPGDDEGSWLPFVGDDDPIETPIVAFVCSERAADALREYGRRAASGEEVSYPPVLPVGVNCTDTVGEAHVVHAFAAGADGVAIVGCGESCLHSGADPKAALVDRLDRALADLGLGRGRVEFFAPDRHDPETFVEVVEGFETDLESTPVEPGEYQATGRTREGKPNPAFNSHGWTLESVRALLAHDGVEPTREIVRGLKDFGRMEVNDACNLTPTCSTLCPTDAIERTDDGDLRFSHADCVNCGLCEEGCPETAITMHDGLYLSLLPENRDGERWQTVFEGEMLECARCGEPFTSVGSAESIKEQVGDLVEGVAPHTEGSVFDYCGDCRAVVLFEEGGR